jgi:hypothetical protein
MRVQVWFSTIPANPVTVVCKRLNLAEPNGLFGSVQNV